METSKAFVEHGIPFAASFEVRAFDRQVARYLAKPKKGRGSRGLLLQPRQWRELGEEYMIQELAEGREVTTAFYVTKERRIHGHITMTRALQSGTTMECEVTAEFDHLVVPVIEAMNRHFHLLGSINVQAIATGTALVPFEVNARISGTNSIRSQFGFHDVKYAVQEYLWNEKPDAPVIQPGSAVRVLMDIIYPHRKVADIGAGTGHAYLY
jgi:carbamoyl-phosphate synthase large subunit